MKKAMMIFLILLVVFFSGCTSTNSSNNPNNGLVVNDFSADPRAADSTDVVRFFQDAQNVGGTTARCVTSELFGVDNWRTTSGQAISTFGPIIPSQGLGLTLDFQNGIFSGCYTDVQKGSVCVNYVKDNGVSLSGFLSSSFIQFSDQLCNSYPANDQKLLLTKFQPQLFPQDPSIGRSGQSLTNEWFLLPPVLPEGSHTTYPVTVRTSFFYDTNSIMQVDVFSKEDYRTESTTGQLKLQTLAVRNSFAAPVQVSVVKGDEPIVVDPIPAAGNYDFRSYTFRFTNVGQGFPLPLQGDYTPGSSGFIVATMKVSGAGNPFFSDCLGQSGNEIVVGPDVMQNVLKLRQDQSVPVGCTIALDRTPWLTTPKGTITFEFNLFYRYYIDKTVSVEVNGLQGLS